MSANAAGVAAGEIEAEDADSLDAHRDVAVDVDVFADNRGRKTIDDRLIEALQPMLARKLATASSDEIEDKAIELYQGVVRSAQSKRLPRPTLEMLAALIDEDPDELLGLLEAA